MGKKTEQTKTILKGISTAGSIAAAILTAINNTKK